jgi:hypothetical protein
VSVQRRLSGWQTSQAPFLFSNTASNLANQKAPVLTSFSNVKRGFSAPRQSQPFRWTRGFAPPPPGGFAFIEALTEFALYYFNLL